MRIITVESLCVSLQLKVLDYLSLFTNFKICGQNPMVLPFKWNLLGSSFTKYQGRGLASPPPPLLPPLIFGPNWGPKGRKKIFLCLLGFYKTNLLYFFWWIFFSLAIIKSGSINIDHMTFPTFFILYSVTQKLHIINSLGTVWLIFTLAPGRKPQVWPFKRKRVPHYLQSEGG